MGAADLARVHPPDQPVEHGVVVAHIPHGGDARDQVQQRLVLLQVGVHLVHAGDQGPASAVDSHLTGRLGAVGGFDGGDHLVVDQHRHRLCQRSGLRVEQADVCDADGGVVAMRHLLLDVDEPAGRPVGGQSAQPGLLALIALADHDKAGVDGGEEAAIAVEEHGLGREVDAGQIVSRDLDHAAVAVDRERLAFLQAQRAAGERRRGHTRTLQQDPGVDLVRPWAAALGDIKARGGDRRLCRPRGIDPLGVRAGLGEVLVDLAAEGGCALDRPDGRQAVRAQGHGFNHGRPAAIVLEIEVHVDVRALGLGDHVTDVLAAGDDREAFRLRRRASGQGDREGRGGEKHAESDHDSIGHAAPIPGDAPGADQWARGASKCR